MEEARTRISQMPEEVVRQRLEERRISTQGNLQQLQARLVDAVMHEELFSGTEGQSPTQVNSSQSQQQQQQAESTRLFQSDVIAAAPQSTVRPNQFISTATPGYFPNQVPVSFAPPIPPRLNFTAPLLGTGNFALRPGEGRGLFQNVNHQPDGVVFPG